MQENRPPITENQKLLLFAEVDGVCPNCPNVLMYDKNGRKYKEFQIAHIYPLNPKPHEIETLKDEERLSKDPNHLDNLVCLCESCHTKFDKPRTVEEYQKLVLKKKDLIRLNNEKSIWKNTILENEIGQIIHSLASGDIDFEVDEMLNYDPLTIDKKTDDSITILTKRKIHRNVQDYYHIIRQKFVDLDNETPLTTETISTQIKSHYLLLSKRNESTNQKEIFDGMVNWLKRQTNQTTHDASEIVVSYFIQNCEVF